MEHEIRYYLKQIKAAMAEPACCDDPEPFKPSYMVTAIKLPTGAIELTVNTEHIAEKIDYILDTYDGDMCHKLDRNVVLQNIMVV